MPLETASWAEVVADSFFTVTRRRSVSGENCLRIGSNTGRVRDSITRVAMNGPELFGLIGIESIAEALEVADFDGVSLEQRMSMGAMDQGTALVVLHQCARSLDALHEQGVIHGTFRAQSVLINEQQNIRLIDWPLAFDSLTLEQSQELFGHAAPEVLLGDAAVAESDQYALGIIAHRLLTGKRAFDGATKTEAILSLLLGVWNRPDAPPIEGHEAFDRVFSPDLAHRFSSCEQFVQVLERELRVAEQLSVTVARPMISPPPVPEVVAEAQPSRWRRLVFGIAGMMSVAVFGLGILSWLTQRTQAAAELKAQSISTAAGSDVGGNGRMKVCNSSTQPVQIRHLAVAYWNAGNTLSTFQGSGQGSHGWRVSPSSEQSLSWTPTEGAKPTDTAWDGSVVFYFLDIEAGGRQFLLSGPWSDAVHGCLALTREDPH